MPIKKPKRHVREPEQVHQGITLRLQTIKNAFKDLSQYTKSQRNHTELTPYQIYIIKRARWERNTPKELEELTGLSVYRIHQVVNMNMPIMDVAVDKHGIVVKPNAPTQSTIVPPNTVPDQSATVPTPGTSPVQDATVPSDVVSEIDVAPTTSDDSSVIVSDSVQDLVSVVTDAIGSVTLGSPYSSPPSSPTHGDELAPQSYPHDIS